MEDLFSKEYYSLIIGTADSEWCLDLTSMKKIVELDWKHWGNLILNVVESIISSHGNVAWLTTEGTVNSISSEDKIYNNMLKK